ncbi:hypothetical protein FH972_021303 [Carpinus fangiana]|uniref:Uncharacterized protein n=1 Tax=Carpinus fangiana TaxID=176857 RepID=A0A5N6KNZ2_9ROSI|nr:hypothetical protein FH972_021303 [Carpinus fangiana]
MAVSTTCDMSRNQFPKYTCLFSSSVKAYLVAKLTGKLRSNCEMSPCRHTYMPRPCSLGISPAPNAATGVTRKTRETSSVKEYMRPAIMRR